MLAGAGEEGAGVVARGGEGGEGERGYECGFDIADCAVEGFDAGGRGGRRDGGAIPGEGGFVAGDEDAEAAAEFGGESGRIIGPGGVEFFGSVIDE